MSTDPTTINNERLRLALESLGIGDYRNIRHIEVVNGGIIVTRFRRDQEGNIVVAGNEAAVVTTMIGIEPDTGDPA